MARCPIAHSQWREWAVERYPDCSRFLTRVGEIREQAGLRPLSYTATHNTVKAMRRFRRDDRQTTTRRDSPCL